jgi:hypothetical protein
MRVLMMAFRMSKAALGCDQGHPVELPIADQVLVIDAGRGF